MNSSLAILSAILAATAFDTTFDRAVRAEADGDNATAIQVYEQLIAEGVSNSGVFYNLGNSYYRAGNPGAAIANYERALQVDPANAAARHNLDFAVQETEHRWARPLPPAWEQSILFWHYDWSPRAVYIAAVVCWLALWVTLAVRLWKPSPYLTRAIIGLTLAAAAFASSAYAKFHPQLLAVSIGDQVPVRYGPGESQTTSFELMSGDRVVVDERRDGWARIRTTDGDRGWINEQSLAFVGPPFVPPGQNSAGQVGIVR